MANKRKIIFRLLWISLIIPGIILVYILFAFLLSYIPVNNSFTAAKNGVDIYIESNGVHTDIVVPVVSEEIDWKKKIDTSKFNEPINQLRYVGFGWGDKGFYLNTPTWADLKFSTAFKAAFWLSTSAMHVTYFEKEPKEDDLCVKIRITHEQYRKLIEHIDQSFQKNSSGQYVIIEGHHYDGKNDNFYEGIGVYNLFRTCNVWTNEGMKKTGVKTALWGPFAWSILRHLR